MCNLVTRLWWGAEILQFVTRLLQGLLQGCDKLVTNMILWSQGCSELAKLLHGCEIVTWV